MSESESDSDKEKMEESEAVCLRCSSTPCEWITYGKYIIEGGYEMFSEEENVENNKKCKAMYCFFYIPKIWSSWERK